MGTVQRIDDPAIIVSLSIVCEDGDEYDSEFRVLRHDNEVEFDVVGMDYYEPEKDLVLNRICQDATFKTFLGTLQQWWKGCHLDPMDGYPNRFNLFLIAIFFLQCFEGVPLWSELAAADFAPFLCTSHTANDVFYSFLHFLVDYSCRYKIDLHVGQCKEKRPGGSLRTWLLRDPCNSSRQSSRST
ncbi:hypothetical protein FRACYDRAFT_238403 [Fragilariopsis cylindrus CCMP1102]|uniref:Uncharacterized protein n=1 Tax=Fragilariopsis cylindrus CCMP1102 TaxID=635003 RepID=A0A1E7FIH3_9STRA|nr:hypothetical protein FRACYDRAFT_238403 [Fragilariopsis cylindrus CCMP1102]|eukprot:OEU17972.1 hypothetical protein FRACYDRAFT_238403 [Fragilariopsis cylindrus CCMP1102]